MISGTSVTVNSFQAFYYELLRQKEKALSFYLKAEVVPPVVDEIHFSEDKSDKNIADVYAYNDELEGTIVAIQKKLIMAINSASELVSVKSHLPACSVNDMRYLFTVLADETFLNINWEGKERWKQYLLEKQLFQSEIAGNKFFEMAEETITVTRDEDMAFIYLMSLNLGFKGKFRDENKCDEHIASYRSRLYALVHPLSNRLFYPGRSHLIEKCYEYTCSEGSEIELPDTKYWITCIVVVFAVYISVSYIVWYGITNDIYTLVDQISLQMRQHPIAIDNRAQQQTVSYQYSGV